MWNNLQSNFNCLYCNDNNEDDSCEDMLEVKKCMLYFLLNNGGYDMRLCIVVWILKKILFLHLQQGYFLRYKQISFFMYWPCHEQ